MFLEMNHLQGGDLDYFPPPCVLFCPYTMATGNSYWLPVSPNQCMILSEMLECNHDNQHSRNFTYCIIIVLDSIQVLTCHRKAFSDYVMTPL